MPTPFPCISQCSVSHPPPTSCEIVQPMKRGILSDIGKYWCALSTKAADIWYALALSLQNPCHHYIQIRLHSVKTYPSLPLVKQVLSDVKWARSTAEYREGELGWGACVSFSLFLLWVCACTLLFVTFSASLRHCLHFSVTLHRKMEVALLWMPHLILWMKCLIWLAARKY